MLFHCIYDDEMDQGILCVNILVGCFFLAQKWQFVSCSKF